jgi:hypothetical protein
MSKVRLYGNTSGYVDLAAPDVAGDVTITLPNATGPFALESYVDAAVAAIPGIGSNVVQTVKTDTFSASIAQGSTTPITGLSVTITPSSNTSKVFVFGYVNALAQGNSATTFVLKRDSTSIQIGDAAGSRVRRTTASGTAGVARTPVSGSFFCVDAPATDLPITYSLDVATEFLGTGSVYINRSETDTDGSQFTRTASTIIAIEVKA